LIMFFRVLLGNFWQAYGRHPNQSANIETLIAKESCTVEQVLDEEDLLQVLKYNNDKIITL
jgi:hypothetical protein